jgi:serine/threonine protein kinase
MQATPSGSVAWFGPFELDLKAGELHRANGKVVRLQEQPFQVLKILLAHPGKVVTREELRRILWPNDTMVAFDQSINAAIKKLRLALQDSAENPQYVETIARRGYRLIVPVEWPEAGSSEGKPNEVARPAERITADGTLIGKKVSHYRVLQVLGGGGMGIVYAAEDLKLGRRVALKFLPEELAQDAAAMQRFEREARAASALNHPNICTIYAIEEHEAQPFIVMELLEGQTLREMISAAPLTEQAPAPGVGPLPLEKLLNIAIQAVGGLDAAHKRGIIHRDIKPANVFVTLDGQAKILDFGLAKLQQFDTADVKPETLEEQERKPECNPLLALTRTGTAVGTAAYMSPEQVRAEKLDARTDLFSFGLVMYEMVTGQRTFAGATAAVLHNAILNQTPAPVRSLNPQIPARLEAVINKAIEKERTARYQSAAEIRADLETLQRTSKQIESYLSWHRNHLVLLGLVVLVLGAATALWFGRRASHGTFSDLDEQQLTFKSPGSTIASPRISPNGKYLAYSDLAGIHVRLLGTGEERTLPLPAEVSASGLSLVDSWFPDSTQLLIHLEQAGGSSSMWIISLTGQSPRRLRHDSMGWSISPDGSLIAFSPSGASGELWLMDSRGEGAKKIRELPANERALRSAHWSPDGQRLAYIRYGESGTTIETCDLRGANRTTLAVPTPEHWMRDMCWLSDGRIVYANTGYDEADGDLWQLAVDAHSGKPLGTPIRIRHWAGWELWALSGSTDGDRLVFLKAADRIQAYVAELAPGGMRIGPLRRLTNDEADSFPTAWTADSKSVLIKSIRNGRWGIFRQLITENAAEPVLTGPEDVNLPRLSPDGAWVLYIETVKSAANNQYPVHRMMRVPVNGGLPQFVFDMQNTCCNYSCAIAPASICVIQESPDRKQAVLTSFDPAKGRGKVLRNLGAVGSFTGRLSLDGSTYAVARAQAAETRIKLLSLTGGHDREIVLKDWPNLMDLDWAVDGKGLYCGFTSPQGGTLVYVELNGTTHELWHSSELGAYGNWMGGFPSPDGQHLVMFGGANPLNVWMVSGISSSRWH